MCRHQLGAKDIFVDGNSWAFCSTAPAGACLSRFSLVDRIANIIFALGFVLCCTVISYASQYVVTIRHLTWGIMTLVSFVLLSKGDIVKSPVFVAFLIYWFWVTYSICFAINQGEAIYQSCKVLRDITFLFCAVSILKRYDISKVVILTAIGLGLFSLFEFFSKPLSLRVGLMGNKNLCSASLVLLMILCIYYYRQWKVPSLIAMALCMFAIITLRARSSWLALTVTGLMFAITNRKYLVISLCCFAFAGILYGTKDSSIFNTASLKHRLELWKLSARMIKDNPAGIGAGNWRIALPKYIRYADPEMRDIIYTTDAGGKSRIWSRAHNDFIQKGVEIGILGAISYLAIFIFALCYSRGIARAGVVAYMTLACFTFPDEWASLVYLLMIFFALALKECKVPTIRLKRVYAVGIVALLVPSVICFGIRHQTAGKMTEIEMARNVDWDKVITETDNISSLANLDMVGMPLAYYRGVAFAAKKDPANALESFRSAKAANPYHLHILMNLAAVSVACGDVRDAENILASVKEMYPDFQDVEKGMKVAERHRLRSILLGMKND